MIHIKEEETQSIYLFSSVIPQAPLSSPAPTQQMFTLFYPQVGEFFWEGSALTFPRSAAKKKNMICLKKRTMCANPFLLLVICLLSVFVTVLYSISTWNRGQLRKMATEKPSQEDLIPLLYKRANSTTLAAQFSGELISSAISSSTTTASTTTSPATQGTLEEPPDRNRGRKLHYTVFHSISQKITTLI